MTVNEQIEAAVEKGMARFFEKNCVVAREKTARIEEKQDNQEKDVAELFKRVNEQPSNGNGVTIKGPGKQIAIIVVAIVLVVASVINTFRTNALAQDRDKIDKDLKTLIELLW